MAEEMKDEVKTPAAPVAAESAAAPADAASLQAPENKPVTPAAAAPADAVPPAPPELKKSEETPVTAAEASAPTADVASASAPAVETAAPAAAPAPEVKELTDQEKKAVAALGEVAQHPEAANAMLSDPQKAGEYFDHLATMLGKNAEEAKTDFALKLQEFLKQKEAEFAPQKQKMDGLQKQVTSIEAEGKALQDQTKSASRTISIATAVGAVAAGLVGFFGLSKWLHGSKGGDISKLNRTLSTLITTVAGGFGAAFTSAKLSLGPIHKRSQALQGQYQNAVTQAQAVQEDVNNKLKPAINEFVSSYVSSVMDGFVERTGKAIAYKASDVAAQQAPDAQQGDSRSATVANILASGGTSPISPAAILEQKAAANGVGGRAA